MRPALTIVMVAMVAWVAGAGELKTLNPEREAEKLFTLSTNYYSFARLQTDLSATTKDSDKITLILRYLASEDAKAKAKKAPKAKDKKEAK